MNPMLRGYTKGEPIDMTAFGAIDGGFLEGQRDPVKGLESFKTLTVPKGGEVVVDGKVLTMREDTYVEPYLPPPPPKPVRYCQRCGQVGVLIDDTKTMFRETDGSAYKSGFVYFRCPDFWDGRYDHLNIGMPWSAFSETYAGPYVFGEVKQPPRDWGVVIIWATVALALVAALAVSAYQKGAL